MTKNISSKNPNPKTNKISDKLPAEGQVAQIGRDVFQVIGFQPVSVLFRMSESGVGYSSDIPTVQRIREGVVTGDPMPFPIFGEVRWFKSVETLNNWYQGSGPQTSGKGS